MTNQRAQDEIAILKQDVARLTAQLALKESQLARSENQRHRAERKYEECQADVQMLEELGRYLTSSLALEQVMEHIYQSFNVLDNEVFLLGLYDDQKQQIDVSMIMVEQQKLAAVVVDIQDSSSPAAWCVQNKQELIILEHQDNLKYFTEQQCEDKRGTQMDTIVYQPLMVGQQVVGCISVQNARKNGFNKEQLDTIRTLSAYSSIAIANAMGYQRLAQTLETLKSAQNQLILQEKMASLGTLTAGVAHEINNPVNFAHVGAENLSVDLLRFESFLLELASEDADQDILDSLSGHFVSLFEHITTIKKGTRRIKSIVQDLRAFTQLDNSEKHFMDIAECIQSTINLIRSQNVSVAKFFTDLCYVPQIQCYPAQLNQVFMNIILNACDAIVKKQCQQDCTALGEIKICSQLFDKKVVISFTDNGCGMNEESLNKVFEPFYTTKVVGKGTGLGMAISFGIIEEHGGSIEIESIIDQGTKVLVTLPVSDPIADF